MKRSLIIIIPILLLVVLNSCNMGSLPQYSNEQWTAIASTQQVMARTENDKIKYWLNALPTDYDDFDELEKILVGRYDVTSVVFPNDYYFEVHMNCECASGSDCCDPERMFMLTLERMNRFENQILATVPDTTQYLDVVCYDHKFAFAALYAPWNTVKRFLIGEAEPSEVSSGITRLDMP